MDEELCNLAAIFRSNDKFKIDYLDILTSIKLGNGSINLLEANLNDYFDLAASNFGTENCTLKEYMHMVATYEVIQQRKTTATILANEWIKHEIGKQ